MFFKTGTSNAIQVLLFVFTHRKHYPYHLFLNGGLGLRNTNTTDPIYGGNKQNIIYLLLTVDEGEGGGGGYPRREGSQILSLHRVEMIQWLCDNFHGARGNNYLVYKCENLKKCSF